VVTLVLAAAVVVPVSSSASSPVGAQPSFTGHASCKYATIGGQRKCIARGQFCAKAKQRDYLRYGLSCSKRDYNGRWHLR
jgi:hypothetical protein